MLNELYDACVNYLAKNWLEVQKLNPDTFDTDMTMLLMQDMLKAAPALRDKILLMAAAYKLQAETEEWEQVVKQQVTSADFAAQLTHSLLVELYDEVNAQLITRDVIKVLDLIPNAVTVAASQRAVQAQTTHKKCTRCGQFVTQQHAAYDKDCCITYKHAGPLKVSSGFEYYSCCRSTSKGGGCVKDPRTSHTLAEPFK